MVAVFIHADELQRLVYPPPDLLRRYAEILRRKGHVLLDDVRHDLVIRVLEHHADRAPYFQQQRLVARVHAVDRHAAALRQENRVHMLCQRGLAAAVVTQNGHEASLRNAQIQTVENDMLLVFILSLIAVDQLVHADCLFFHNVFPVALSLLSTVRCCRRAGSVRCRAREGPAPRIRYVRRIFSSRAYP